MTATDQTIQQLARFFGKIAQKMPACEEACVMTDIHVRVSQDSGDLMAFDDEENEITRCVVEQWIDNKDDNFYVQVANLLRLQMSQMRDVVENLGIMKPYNYVLEDDDRECVAELYVVDDDTLIVGGDLMVGLDEDLDNFFSRLMNEDT